MLIDEPRTHPQEITTHANFHQTLKDKICSNSFHSLLNFIEWKELFQETVVEIFEIKRIISFHSCGHLRRESWKTRGSMKSFHLDVASFTFITLLILSSKFALMIWSKLKTYRVRKKIMVLLSNVFLLWIYIVEQMSLLQYCMCQIKKTFSLWRRNNM